MFIGGHNISTSLFQKLMGYGIWDIKTKPSHRNIFTVKKQMETVPVSERG